jgi:hypothetical protein
MRDHRYRQQPAPPRLRLLRRCQPNGFPYGGPAGRRLRPRFCALVAHGENYREVADLAAELGNKPSGGHWNSGIAVLRNNGLIEIDGKRYRAAPLFRGEVRG